jgi:hypothetical protein
MINVSVPYRPTVLWGEDLNSRFTVMYFDLNAAIVLCNGDISSDYMLLNDRLINICICRLFKYTVIITNYKAAKDV